MRSPLYGTQRWRRRSQQQLRHHPLCKYCLALFGRAEPATVADHVIPHRGDERLFWEGELQSLCTSCHDSLKKQQEQTGEFTGSCAHGYPLDPNHVWNRDGGCPQCKARAADCDFATKPSANERPPPNECVRRNLTP